MKPSYGTLLGNLENMVGAVELEVRKPRPRYLQQRLDQAKGVLKEVRAADQKEKASVEAFSADSQDSPACPSAGRIVADD